MKSPEWNAKFDSGSLDGMEVPIGKKFAWGNEICHVPAVYLCDEGLIVDLYIETEREEYRVFLEKWRDLFDREKNGGNIDDHELRWFEEENPQDRRFRTAVWVNGCKLKYKGGNGMSWIPADLNPIMTDQIDMQPFMIHYRLDQNKVWQFRREKYDWAEEGIPVLNQLEIDLMQHPKAFRGTAFSMPQKGDTVKILDPLKETAHVLTVKEIQKESITIPEQFSEYEMPAQATVMVYTLEPDLPHEAFQLRDIHKNDQARKKDGQPYHAGAVSMMLRLPKDGTHIAASSMRFQAPEQIVWEPVFRAKTVEDIRIKLI